MLRYQVMLALSYVVLWSPRWLAYRLAAGVAALAYVFNRNARRVAEVNARRALGPCASEQQVRRVMRGSLRAAANYYTDLARTPRMDPGRFAAENLRLHHFDRVVAAHNRGRGVIVATIHYGNPEYVSQCMSAFGYHVFALTEPLEPRLLADLFQRKRSSQGQTFMPVSRAAIKAAIRHLRGGGVLCIMADRDIQHNGVLVPFLGGVARIPTGAVDFARHTGAALVPAVTRRRGLDRFDLYVEPELLLRQTGKPEEDRRANSESLIRTFEPYLRRDPSQWFVLEEPIWVDQRDILSSDGHR